MELFNCFNELWKVEVIDGDCILMERFFKANMYELTRIDSPSSRGAN